MSFTDSLRSTSAFDGGGAEFIDGVMDEMEGCFTCVCVVIAGGRCDTAAPAEPSLAIKSVEAKLLPRDQRGAGASRL